MLRKLLFLFFLFASGCTSVSFQAPGNRFITSESQGDKFLKGRFHFGAHGGSEIEIINDKFSATPTANPSISEDSGMQLGLELNALPKLDLYYIGNQDSYDSGGLKFQILGNNIKEAKASDFSLALGGGFLFSSMNDKEDENNSVKIDADVSFGGYEYFLLLGYRPSDDMLLYAGPWFVKFDIDAKLNRTQGGTTTQTIATTGDGKQTNAIFGFQYGKTVLLNVEGAIAKTEYKAKTPSVVKADDKSYFVWGTTISFTW